MTEEQDKELREWLAEYATSNQGDSYYVVTPDVVQDYEIEQLQALITAHTNAEIVKVLDRLERESFAAADEQIDVVPLSAIEAERNKLKEVK